MCLISLGLGLGVGAAIAEGVAAVVGLAGATIGVAGAAISADQQQAALEFEQEQAEANRRIQEQQAQDIMEQGEWEKRNLALQQRASLASQQASAAGSGVLLNHGSNLVMQEDQAQTNMIDQRQLAYDVESRAYQARLGAWQSQNRINSLQAQRDNASTAGVLGTVGALNSGLGSTLSAGASGALLGSKLYGGGSDASTAWGKASTLTQRTGFGAGPGAFESWNKIF